MLHSRGNYFALLRALGFDRVLQSVHFNSYTRTRSVWHPLQLYADTAHCTLLAICCTRARRLREWLIATCLHRA